MPGVERCASPEEVPHLEPLSAPNSDSLHDPSIVPPSEALAHGSTKEKPDRDFGQLMRAVTVPLKLSLVLENKGNVARDHLASERTYLAYVRTSLACASAGVGACVALHLCFCSESSNDGDTALVQLFSMSATSNVSTQQSGVDLNKAAKPLGATIILLGLIVLVFGTYTTYLWAPLTKLVSPFGNFYRPRSLLHHTVRTPSWILSRGAECHHDDRSHPRVAGWHRLRHHCCRNTELITYASVYFALCHHARRTSRGRITQA